MLKFIQSATALCVCLVFVSCGEKLPEVKGLTDKGATVIIVDHHGKLREYFTVTPEMGVKQIEFIAPESGEEIKGYAIGPNVHETIKPSFSVSTKVGPGFAGKITVAVEDGMVTSIAGNSMSMMDQPEEQLLQKVGTLIQEGKDLKKPSTVITLTDRKVGDLVEDEAGNLVPRDMTEAEKAFLDKVISAIKAKDLDLFETMVHRRPSDRNSQGIINHLKVGMERDMDAYRFMRINREHVVHEKLLNEYRFSLPIEWDLRIDYGKKDAPYTGYNLYIGQENGEFKFPTKYGSL